MSFIDKLKADALSTWDAIEGKLSSIKSPALRLLLVAGAVLVALSFFSQVMPLILGLVLTIGVVVLLFKLFHDDDSPK